LLVETRTGKSLRDRLTGLEQELADSRVNAQRLTDELQSAQKQISDSQVASQQQLELAEQEISRRKAALAETTRHLDTLDQEKQRIAATLADTTRHLDALNQEKERTAAALADSQRRLDALTATLSAEHSRATGLTQENQRLEQAYAALRQSLEAELADRDLKLRQAQSRVVVTILDHVLFDSGRATLKPAGMKVLDQLSAALKRTEDKEIHVEGHTDNRPIRGPLAKQYATNWELSSARATTVVRYLIEQAGLPATSLSAVGYADTKPVASNDTEQSRAENRRIEILLYPKGLPRSTLALN
jgi:chemotaxis protein MotB